jgi:hypothetical protein
MEVLRREVTEAIEQRSTPLYGPRASPTCRPARSWREQPIDIATFEYDVEQQTHRGLAHAGVRTISRATSCADTSARRKERAWRPIGVVGTIGP